MKAPIPKALKERLTPAAERVTALIRDFEWTWTNAVVFSVAFSFLILISMAVIPSWWLYYADKRLEGWDGSGQGHLIPFFGLDWIPLDGFWLNKVRDLIATGLIIGPLVTFLVAAALLQNYRRKLRGGSFERPSGGYR
jgi:hypothetical protein